MTSKGTETRFYFILLCESPPMRRFSSSPDQEKKASRISSTDQRGKETTEKRNRRSPSLSLSHRVEERTRANSFLCLCLPLPLCERRPSKMKGKKTYEIKFVRRNNNPRVKAKSPYALRARRRSRLTDYPARTCFSMSKRRKEKELASLEKEKLLTSNGRRKIEERSLATIE